LIRGSERDYLSRHPGPADISSAGSDRVSS
jgi:hypothetical protein